MLGNLSFIADRPIICKTDKYIDRSDNSSPCVLGESSLIGRSANRGVKMKIKNSRQLCNDYL
jgi:hypothetical protein